MFNTKIRCVKNIFVVKRLPGSVPTRLSKSKTFVWGLCPGAIPFTQTALNNSFIGKIVCVYRERRRNGECFRGNGDSQSGAASGEHMRRYQEPRTPTDGTQVYLCISFVDFPVIVFFFFFSRCVCACALYLVTCVCVFLRG